MTWRFAGSCVSEKILGQEFLYTAEIYEVVAHPRMESYNKSGDLPNIPDSELI